MGDDELHDPYCGGCEMAQADYKELEKVVGDLAILIRRLVSKLAKIQPDNELSVQAMDYLIRNNLAGSPLRGELQGDKVTIIAADLP